MTITHDVCRDALAGGAPVDDRVDAHLQQCAACRSFAHALTDLETLAESAREAIAPAGLSERTVAAVAAARSAGLHAGGEVVELRRRRPMRRAALSSAAAVVLIVAGVFVAGREPSVDPDKAVLISAASRLEEAGTAEVTVDATAEVAVDVRDDGTPNYAAAPEEMRGHLEREWQKMIAAFEADVAAFEEEMNARIREGEQRMADAVDDMFANVGRGGSAPPSAPRAPTATRPPAAPRTPPDQGTPPAPPAPRLPAQASLGVRVTATGVVNASGGAALTGSVRPVGGTLAVPDSQAAFAVHATADGAAVRTPDGSWQRARQRDGGPLAAVLLDGRALPRLLRDARSVARVGAVQVDGAAATRYRFVTAGPDGQRWTAVADVDAGGDVRSLTFGDLAPDAANGSTVRVGIRATAGAGASPSTLPASEAPPRAPSGASVSFYPVGAAVRTAFEAGASR
ncbi:MAG TPA: hypothetical protein VF230_02885 [Acidimicrobiales bacterium]